MNITMVKSTLRAFEDAKTLHRLFIFVQTKRTNNYFLSNLL